jgi:L-2,4-diaminobutyrate decarboxylase
VLSLLRYARNDNKPIEINKLLEMNQNTLYVDTANLSELTKSFKKFFLNDTSESITTYRKLTQKVAGYISEQISSQKQAYSGKSPQDLITQIAEFEIFPRQGMALETLLERTRDLVINHNISVYHPNCLAHLHCPTFIASLTAEMIISAFNQSMDSWDQAPAATMIEQAFCDELCKVYGFDNQADATFTGGGTMSNFMGLLLARDHYSQLNYNWNIQQKGLPPEASKFRILCAEFAHFTVAQSASILGLGENAVVKIKTNDFEEEAAALEDAIISLRAEGLIPIAYVTTAGTTDFGTVGQIGNLAEVAHDHGLWFHVDAAFGGALIFSEKHKYKLNGIHQADSVTVDFHKLFYQPISCGAFIVKNKKSFEYIRLHADYLNPESNEEFGILDLVYKSIQTTRRFDALKPFLALQHIGTEKFGEMIDYTIDLAAKVSDLIEIDPNFELATRTQINAVVFRYIPDENLLDSEIDDLNNEIKTKLLLSGKAIIGQTVVKGRAFLKFTLLNPMTEISSVIELMELIKEMGKR